MILPGDIFSLVEWTFHRRQPSGARNIGLRYHIERKGWYVSGGGCLEACRNSRAWYLVDEFLGSDGKIQYSLTTHSEERRLVLGRQPQLRLWKCLMNKSSDR